MCFVFQALPDGLPEKNTPKDDKTFDGSSLSMRTLLVNLIVQRFNTFLNVFMANMLTF